QRPSPTASVAPPASSSGISAARLDEVWLATTGGTQPLRRVFALPSISIAEVPAGSRGGAAAQRRPGCVGRRRPLGPGARAAAACRPIIRHGVEQRPGDAPGLLAGAACASTEHRRAERHLVRTAAMARPLVRWLCLGALVLLTL